MFKPGIRRGFAARHAPAALALWATLGLAGCPSADEAPTPPDVSDLIAAYASPDGVLTAEVAATLVREADTRLATVADAASLVAVLVGAVDALVGLEALGGSERPLTAAVTSAPGLAQRSWAISLESGGWLELQRRCPGWGDVRDARGQLNLRAVVDGNTVNPVIWGEVEACRALLGDEQRRYDGTVRLHAPGLGREGILLAIAGTLKVGDAERSLDFDARYADGLFYLRQVIDGRSFLLGAVAGQTGGEVRVVDAGGTWRCDVAGCEGPMGEVLRF